ncbi:MAG: CocE/NonD family hydrolase [Acidobacteria bacterium]|nr:CocE/NonD family hydrolase [Acidobacteriota bacterium]
MNKKSCSPAKSARITLPLLVTFLCASISIAQSPAPAEAYQVTVQSGVRVKMRDGVSLIADIYRPKAPGKFPVLLTRTPYNRRDFNTGMYLASRGYVTILQDTRGRFDSEGEFYPFKHEINDGYDTVEWAAALEYANGDVGMFGGSYVGATQMLASVSKPPHLKAIFPYITASEYYDGWTYQSGALMQWFASSWTSGLSEDTLRKKTSSQQRAKDWVQQLPVEDYRLINIPTARDVAPYFRDWVEHERDEKEFPLARAQDTKYYFHSNKGANSAGGDGALSTKPPGKEKPDTYVYDPQNPTPTIGGRLCCGAAIQPGPFDQRPNESRPDVLVFSTPPLERDIEVTGYITAELYASTSAPDTDFTAMIVDVDPSGYARFLTDGVVRARYRNSTERAEPIEPGKVYKYTIDLWATSNVFKAGHRIRVYISSSNFPRFNRNLNTGEPALGATKMVKANQTIYHDADHPSAIILPVIPKIASQ